MKIIEKVHSRIGHNFDALIYLEAGDHGPRWLAKMSSGGWVYNPGGAMPNFVREVGGGWRIAESWTGFMDGLTFPSRRAALAAWKVLTP